MASLKMRHMSSCYGNLITMHNSLISWLISMNLFVKWMKASNLWLHIHIYKAVTGQWFEKIVQIFSVQRCVHKKTCCQIRIIFIFREQRKFSSLSIDLLYLNQIFALIFSHWGVPCLFPSAVLVTANSLVDLWRAADTHGVTTFSPARDELCYRYRSPLQLSTLPRRVQQAERVTSDTIRTETLCWLPTHDYGQLCLLEQCCVSGSVSSIILFGPVLYCTSSENTVS